MKRLATALGLALLLAATPARADVITLDDGSTIEGEILKESDTEIEIKIPYGSTKLPRSRVKKIEKKPSPEQEFQARRAKLDAKDAAGRIGLARWLLEKHFPREKAAELAVEAWRIAPGDEGAIDILVTKLDYHFEKDVWVDPEKWYPTHGYMRKGTTFITSEEQTRLDASALVKKLQESLRGAEHDVASAEKAIGDAPEAEARAQKAVDAADAEVKAVALKKETLKAKLDARETDLKIAADKTIAARRDLAIVEHTTCPQDAPGKQAWDDRCARAKACVILAVTEEDKARRARDAALADLESLARSEQSANDEMRAAKAKLERARADGKTAEANLPAKKAARDAAAERLKQGEAAEKAAEKAAADRAARDVKEAADRLKALRDLAKK